MKAPSILMSPCEVAVRKYVPSIRAAIAIVLVRDYGLSIYRAAKILGLTPAAISNYILGRRGSSYTDIILRDEELYELLNSIARKFVSGDYDERELPRQICTACVKLREKVGDSSYEICGR